MSIEELGSQEGYLTRIRNLPVTKLPEVARDIRNTIMSIVPICGGHYASPLGVVELSIALHYVFCSPVDKIVWDTGHQAYAHKLLTGRIGGFEKLRTPDGPSGFPTITESEHDAFGTGHCSTAIAAAIGLSRSAQVKVDDAFCVAVIGDGALAGGPALEGLALVKDLGTRVVVVLNDNGYAISPTRGALAQQRERSYRQLAHSMGLRFVGPLNGHDILALVQAFQQIKLWGDSVFLQVTTTKGTGDVQAEADPVRRYAIPRQARADSSPGESMQHAVTRALHGIMQEVDSLCVITPGMSEGAGLATLAKRYPSRVLDVGIAEASAVTLGAALAVGGGRVMVHLYSTFLQRAADQLVHDVGLQHLPLVVLVDRVGFSGDDGPTHHGIYDLPYLRVVPGIAVWSLSEAGQVLQAVALAVRKSTGPVAIRISKGASVCWDNEGRTMPLTAVSVRRTGLDLTVLTHGRISEQVLRACQRVEEHGIRCQVVEVARLWPLDVPALQVSILPDCPLAVVEETIEAASLGEAIGVLSGDLRCGRMLHLPIRNGNVPAGPVGFQQAQAGIDEHSLAKAFVELASS